MADNEDAAGFAARMADVVRHGSTTVGLSIGAQMGFFSEMVKFEDCFSPAELADRTSCKPVYVYMYSVTWGNYTKHLNYKKTRTMNVCNAFKT